jgi:hypothetical protein
MPIAAISNGESGLSVRGKLNSLITLANADREALAANLTLYVRTDGDNANTGLTNTSGGAFATWQYAIDYVAGRYDLGPWDITLKQGNSGTFTLPAPLIGRSCVGSGRVILEGDTTTPANCILNLSIAGAGALFSLTQCPTIYDVQGFQVSRTVGAGSILRANANSIINYKNMRFGAATEAHVYAYGGGVCSLQGNCTITGGAFAHLLAVVNSLVDGSPPASTTITLTGTPAFSGAFAYASSFAVINYLNLVSFSGSATGTRYFSNISNIAVPSASTTYFPGNATTAPINNGIYTAS